MEGFEEASVLESTDGLGYRVERKVESRSIQPSAVQLALDPHADLAAIREAKRRQRIEALSKVKTREEIQEIFASGDSDELDAAAAQQASMAGMSLRDRLQRNRELAEAEWQEKHNPFRPPPALSEEDYQLYADMESARRTRHMELRQQDLEEFRMFQEMRAKREEEEKEEERKRKGETADEDGPTLPSVAELDPELSFARFKQSSDAAATSASSTAAASSSAAASSATLPSLSGLIATPAMPPLQLKRKHSEDKSSPNSSNHEKGRDHQHEHKQKKHKKQKTGKGDKRKEKDSPPTQAATSASTESAALPADDNEDSGGGLAGLGAYGSDDD